MQKLESDKTYIMGVLNVTPDSFSDGGKFIDTSRAVEHAQEILAAGADIIDIGGESSRPGSDPVSDEEELERVLPVIETLKKQTNAYISIDTYKSKVANACLEHGVQMVNDITGLTDDRMIEVVAAHHVPVVIMHMQGKSKTMQTDPHYEDVVGEIKKFFETQIEKATKAGITELILDPGIGFGKTFEHNMTLLKHLREFTSFGYPLLVGTSRKSFIGKITGQEVDDRLEGTIASNVIAIMNGAHIIRVHDVKELKAAALVADAIRKAK